MARDVNVIAANLRKGGKFMEKEIRSWMKTELAESYAYGVYVDASTDIGNTTLLAEECAAALCSFQWLDDETHAVWEIAIECMEAHGWGDHA